MLQCRHAVVLALLLTAGCAGLRFNKTTQDNAFTYFEPSPFAVVKVAADCSITVDVISLPGKPRSIGFHSGFGSAKLSVTLANGMITQVGQETDTKIPETLTAVAGLAKSLAPGLVAPHLATGTCPPRVALYAITYDPATKSIALSPSSALVYEASTGR